MSIVFVCVCVCVCVCDVLCLLRQINTKGIRTATKLEAYELCTPSNLSLIRELENDGGKRTKRGGGGEEEEEEEAENNCEREGS